MLKIAFPKCDVITFTWFFGHCTTKNKDTALKFRMLAAGMNLDHIYSGCLDKLKILDLRGNYFWEK